MPACLYWSRRTVDFAGDGAGDLLVDQPARIQREIAEQRRSEHNEDDKINERQLERRRAQQFSQRGHCLHSRAAGAARSRRNLPPRIQAPRACLDRDWPLRPDATPRGRILPEIVFGNSANSSRRTRLNGASAARNAGRSTAPFARSGGMPGDERDESLRHREPHRIGRRHHGGFGDRRDARSTRSRARTG